MTFNTFSGNTLASNAITTNTIPLGAYFFIASYNGIYINQTVNVGGNNNFNFNYVPSTYNNIYVGNYTYFYCLSLNTSQSINYYGSSICVSYTGNISPSAQGLQSQVIGAPFSANLTIYINPEGYFEYIINNGTYYNNAFPSGMLNQTLINGLSNTGTASINGQLYTKAQLQCILNGNCKANFDQIPQSLWLNTPPGTLSTPFNFSILGHTVFSSINSSGNSTSVIANGTYKGAILYSDLIDISPIEYQMLDGNLTPNNFVGFIYPNAGSFYNTTLIYLLHPTTAQIATDWLGIAATWLAKYYTGLVGYVLTASSKTNVGAINNAESSISVSSSIPIILNGIKNYNTSAYQYPLYVSYAYPDALCQLGQLNLGVCIKSGQTGMFGFNNYIDNTYQYQITTNKFLTDAVPAIFVFAILIIIVKKFNGE